MSADCRLCTVNATTTLPFTWGLASTAAASAAQAARRPATGAATSAPAVPYRWGRLVSATGVSRSTPSART